MKTILRCLFGLLVLAACSSTANTTGTTGSALEAGAPTQAPYWDRLPLDSQPASGWKTYQVETLGIAFKYPAVYDEIACGKIFVEEKDLGENTYTLIGFRGGTIRIRIYSRWDEDLDAYIAKGEVKTPPGFQLLTPVEQFSLDGIPAHRHVVRITGQVSPEYIKNAMAISGGRLYHFQYNHEDSIRCDAPPLSEEEVYEYLVSTFYFIE